MIPQAQRPRIEEAGRRANRVMPGGNTRTTVWVPPAPPLAARAEGCRVVDVHGHCVIDMQANYTSLVHGHGRPEVRAAALAAIDEVACVGLPTLAEVGLHPVTHVHPTPLLRKRQVRGVTERIDMFGDVAIPLYEHELGDAVDELIAAGSRRSASASSSRTSTRARATGRRARGASARPRRASTCRSSARRTSAR